MARSEPWSLTSLTRHADCESLRLTGTGTANFAVTRTLLVPFDRVRTLDPHAAPRVVSRRCWTATVLGAAACASPFGALTAAAQARIDLLSFQLEPALAMLRHGRERILIADEVGLGKTIQAALILSELSARDDAFRALVVMPAGLREQWQAELRERFDLPATIAGAAWLGSMSRELPPEVNPWSLPGIYLASLDMVKRPEVLRAIEDVVWDLFVLDEAHAAAVATARLAAAAAIGQRSRRVLLLTATPPDADPPQLAAMAGIGRLDDGDALVEFRRGREDARFGRGRRTVLLQVRPSRAERRMHRLVDLYTRMVWDEAGARRDTRARLVSTVLRKRALSSPPSLAASVRRRAVLLDMTPAAEPHAQLLLPLGDEDPLDDDVSDAVLGAAGLANGATERVLLRDIESAARAAAARETKVAFLLRLLRRAKEPAIVFTEYRDTLLHLERTLRDSGCDPLLLHGAMTLRERTAAQHAFNVSGTLLLATDAASEGLNLHERCRLVVHFELPWTPARLEQRTGRVDRLGQQRRVHEVLLVAMHTAERMVLAPLVRRARAARRRAVTGRSSLAALTESRVAQAVMDAAPVVVEEDAAPGAFAAFAVPEEAREEADRIGFARRRCASRRLSSRPVIQCGRSGAGSRMLTALYRVLLQDGTGRVVHSVLVPLQIAIDLPARLRTAADLRGAFERFEALHGSRCAAIAEDHAASGLRAAQQRHAATCESLRRREQALARHLPSAAQRLVQAGLFDARSLRQSEALHRVAMFLVDENEERSEQIAAAAGLTSHVALIALRIREPQ